MRAYSVGRDAARRYAIGNAAMPIEASGERRLSRCKRLLRRPGRQIGCAWAAGLPRTGRAGISGGAGLSGEDAADRPGATAASRLATQAAMNLSGRARARAAAFKAGAHLRIREHVAGTDDHGSARRRRWGPRPAPPRSVSQALRRSSATLSRMTMFRRWQGSSITPCRSSWVSERDTVSMVSPR